MVAILLLLFGAALFLFPLKDLIFRLKRDVNEVEMHNQFKQLIDFFYLKKEYLKVTSHSVNQTVKMHVTHASGKCVFVLIQVLGVLNIEWQEDHLKHNKTRLEWYYSQNADQHAIFNQIQHDIEIFKLNTKKSLSSIVFTEEDIKNAVLVSTASIFEIGDLCNVAWNYIHYLDGFQPLGSEGRFEVFAFNCFTLLNQMDQTNLKETYKIEQDLIELFIFQLKKNKWIHSIDNVSEFINARIQLYRTYFFYAGQTSQSEISILFKIFYSTPLTPDFDVNVKESFPREFEAAVYKMMTELVQISTFHNDIRL